MDTSSSSATLRLCLVTCLLLTTYVRTQDFVDQGNDCKIPSLAAPTYCQHVKSKERFMPVRNDLIPDGSVCFNEDQHSCLVCSHGKLKFKCPRILNRPKRGFFRKVFKQARRGIKKIIPIRKQIIPMSKKIIPRVASGGLRINLPTRRIFNSRRRHSFFKHRQRRPRHRIFRIRCESPAAPSNGQVACPKSLRFGATCSFQCNVGYTLVGPTSIKCLNIRTFSSKSPTCQVVSCPAARSPVNSQRVHCTNGNKLHSACSLTCKGGYSPGRGANMVCGINSKWSLTDWKCDDVTKPKFINCPKKKVHTLDRKYQWPDLKATDNSGHVVVKQIQGSPGGSIVKVGVHVIKYSASDASGNSALCQFFIEVKQVDCPKPASSDGDIRFTCNGLTVQSVCLLKCASGTYITGSRYIACEQEVNSTTSSWKPSNGDEASCYKKECPTLTPPKNGALACDKQMGGSVCQLQCEESFDVLEGDGTGVTYICGSTTMKWQPSSYVPDCSELAYPDEYFLPTEFHYFIGDCSDPETLKDIKQQFLDNLLSFGLNPCMESTCTIDDIDVSCGELEEGLRRRRAIHRRNMVRIRLTFHLKNKNRKISPKTAKVLLSSLAEKSKSVMSSNKKLREMYSAIENKKLVKQREMYSAIENKKLDMQGFNKFSMMSIRKAGARRRPMLSLSLPSISTPSSIQLQAVTGEMSMTCPPGQTQMKARSGVCVPCPTGTYHNTASGTCAQCPLNTYQENAGTTACVKCSSHHVTSTSGSTESKDCLELCHPGTFSPTGHVPCYPCTIGTYQKTRGSRTCDQCSTHSAGVSSCMMPMKTTNVTSISNKFRISDFLLTCDKDQCLTF